MTVPKVVTIFLSLCIPELKGNTHTVVFTPSLSTSRRREGADIGGRGADEVLKRSTGDGEKGV